MKRIIIVLLSVLLLCGCTAKTENVPTPLDADAEQVIRLESVDGLNIEATDMMGEALTEGEKKVYPMIKEAVIEFPMADDMTQTVAITAEELTQELEDFRKTNNDDLLFLAMLNEGRIIGLAYYLQ